jgi:hypothetical protein
MKAHVKKLQLTALFVVIGMGFTPALVRLIRA